LRLITVSQYLKGSENGSYELDEGSLLADFVNVDAESQLGDHLSDDVVSACKPLLDTVNVVELDSLEVNCLYYLAGYVVSRVIKDDSTSADCISAVRSADFTNELGSTITQLLVLKEFKSGSLVPCNEITFNLLLSCEIYFRQKESSFLSATNNIKQQLVVDLNLSTADIQLPECHNIELKIISRFIGARLQFFAKKQRSIRKELLRKKNSGHELSSKSMQMRKCVSKIK
jgi:hypothetical protein